MTTLKTSTLTDAALDWAVTQIVSGAGPDKAQKQWRYFGRVFKPSTEWSHGGPIIERMKLNRLTTNALGGYTASVKVTLINTEDDAYTVWTHGSGPTPLIAAMRCYVASKLGDTVDVPPELA